MAERYAKGRCFRTSEPTGARRETDQARP
jgi:hypothetical protein